VSTIRWCPADRLGELQSFIDTHWRRGHVLARDAELLRWQHPRLDAGELSVLVADGPRGEMRGILGIIPVPYCARGVRGEGAWLTTWVVVPEARRDQLGLALLREAMDGPDFVGTLGGNDTTMRLLRALRFDTRAAVPRWVRGGAADALRGLLTAAGTELPAAAAAALESAQVAAAAPGMTVEPWSSDAAAAWDRAWTERIAPRTTGTWRDSAYLDWRYVRHPRFHYELRLARDAGGEALALLAYRRQAVHDRPEEIVRVVELLGDPEGTRALAVHLAEEAIGERTAFADFYCTSEPFAAALTEGGGFVPEAALGISLPALFQPLDARRTALTAALWAGEEGAFAGDDVYFTRSDCDQDRPN
jgi:hypothetical protein